uniref:Reverse transcriptase domain-containing protein n=1 Tax=Tanacetum cinerariifolium TaxID=118510 RepID=A0A6L2J4U5_TANCI|nr:hypothetical protein [Tanacetum cinerariifolium]
MAISSLPKKCISNDDEGKMIERNFFEIQGTFFIKVRDSAFNGEIRETVFEHINKFLKVVGPIKINGACQDQYWLSIFPISLAGAAGEWFRKDCIGSVISWDDLVEKIIQKFYQLSVHNDDIKEDDDPNDIADIFKIEGNLFDFETHMCEAFNDFNHLLKIDKDLFTFDIQGTRTYEEYKLNNPVTRDLKEPWLDNRMPFQLCDHICKQYRFKNEITKWPTCSSDTNWFCNSGCAFLRKKFKEDLFTSGIEHGIYQDPFEPSNDNPNVVNAPREPFVVNQDPGKTSSQSPPQTKHHCCYGYGDPLEGIFCHQCTCELCGNGARYGYNCPSKVPIIPNPKPFNNQTIKELTPTVQSFDPKSDLDHKSPNVFNPPPQLPFISCEFYGNDARYGHYCTPQVPFVYPEPCYNQDLNFPQEFQDYYHEQNSCYDSNSFGFDPFQPQRYSVNHPVFNIQNELFDSQNKLMEQLTSMCDMVGQLIQKKEEAKKINEAQAANARYWKIPACYDDDDGYNFAITPNEPVNSLSIGDEHLDTISATESDEFIKSSVENLVPNSSESEGESECDMPVCEEFTTFSNSLFDSDYDFYSSDDQSYPDEDLPKEIYSNPLFDEEIIPMKIDPHPFNAESDLIESMLNHDSSIIISLKIDSLFGEFVGELTLLKSIPPGIDETDCYHEEETHFTKRLLYDNSSPHPPEEFVSENSDATIESFSPSPIPVEDSDSLMEEIDLSFTPDYPMPSGIEEDDYDSEGDILILEELLSNDSLLLLKKESFHFDIPSFFHPPAKPPDGNTGILNVKMIAHLGLETFQPSAECPMIINGKNTPILDVPLFHFYPP